MVEVHVGTARLGGFKCVLDRVEVCAVMDTGTGEIEEKVAVRKNERTVYWIVNKLGRMSYNVMFFEAELRCDPNSPRLNCGVIQILPG